MLTSFRTQKSEFDRTETIRRKLLHTPSKRILTTFCLERERQASTRTKMDSTSSTVSPPSKEHQYYAAVGDAAYRVTFLSTAAFAVAVALFVETDKVFDPQWKRDGFCVANSETPYWNSHDLCLYVDVSLAAFLALLHIALRGNKKASHGGISMEGANEYIIPNVVGQIAHGIGHEAIAAKLRKVGNSVEQTMDAVARLPFAQRWREESVAKILLAELPGAVFWLGLIYATMAQSRALKNTKSTVAWVALAALLARIGQSFMPPRFGFTYVQTVLMLLHAFSQTRRPLAEKDFFYASFPVIVSVPLIFMGWLESTQCSAFVQEKFYGHLLYDGYVGVSLIVWYLVCYSKVQSDTSKVKTV